MSWRDRIVRNHPAQKLVAAASISEAIGTIGTIGDQTFSAIAGHAATKKQDRYDHDSLAGEVQEPFAICAETANRAQARHTASESDHASSAESANRSDSGFGPWDEAEEERTTVVEHDAGAIRSSVPSESALLAPGVWFERFVTPGEPPFDQPCPDRRGLVRREGTAFLHFCVVCGGWGAFGYDVLGSRPGRWYCLEHRPSS